MPFIKLDHAVVAVSDWSRSNAFYKDVLGAELVPVGKGWSYRFGNQQLNLHVSRDRWNARRAHAGETRRERPLFRVAWTHRRGRGPSRAAPGGGGAGAHLVHVGITPAACTASRSLPGSASGSRAPRPARSAPPPRRGRRP